MTTPIHDRLGAAVLLTLTFVASTSITAQENAWIPVRTSIQTPECLEPDVQRAATVRLQDLVGEFVLVLYVTDHVEQDPVVRGRLHLQRWNPRISGVDTVHIYWTHWGWSSILLSRIGDIPVGPPVSSHDPQRPGVLAHWDRGREKITLYFGSRTPDYVVTLHAGLLAQVLASDATRFKGKWQAPGYPKPGPSGYFCAWRVRG